jgi:hypothetical protein
LLFVQEAFLLWEPLSCHTFSLYLPTGDASVLMKPGAPFLLVLC